MPWRRRLRARPDGAFELLAFAEIAGLNHYAAVVPNRARLDLVRGAERQVDYEIVSNVTVDCNPLCAG